MCLLSDTDIPKIAQEDIVCYKVLIKVSGIKALFGKGYLTPWCDTKVRPKGLFKAKGGKSILRNCFKPGTYDVGRGFIHTYTGLDGSRIPKNLIGGHRMFECIIPKGTEYFVSIDGEEYASDCIIFKREMKCRKIDYRKIIG